MTHAVRDWIWRYVGNHLDPYIAGMRRERGDPLINAVGREFRKAFPDNREAPMDTVALLYVQYAIYHMNWRYAGSHSRETCEPHVEKVAEALYDAIDYDFMQKCQIDKSTLRVDIKTHLMSVFDDQELEALIAEEVNFQVEGLTSERHDVDSLMDECEAIYQIALTAFEAKKGQVVSDDNQRRFRIVTRGHVASVVERYNPGLANTLRLRGTQ